MFRNYSVESPGTQMWCSGNAEDDMKNIEDVFGLFSQAGKAPGIKQVIHSVSENIPGNTELLNLE